MGRYNDEMDAIENCRSGPGKRKWTIKFIRGVRLNNWYCFSGSRNTVARGIHVWTPFGGHLDICGTVWEVVRMQALGAKRFGGSKGLLAVRGDHGTI